MKNEDALTKLNKELEANKTSLASKMNKLKDKIEQFNKFKNSVILCDVSGSMCSFVSKDARAIDVVNAVIENFRGANIWEFSGANHIVKTTKLSGPLSSTAMGTAFDVMKSQGFKEFILITDGEPDSEADALKNARGLKINIIYIGPSPTPLFLIKLAKITNGNFVDVELIKLGDAGAKELENKVRLMLNP